MKIPLKIEKISDNVDCYEDVSKTIQYRISNNNRHVVSNIDVTAQTIKEDGEKTRSNFCKKITGIKPRLLPNEDCVITCYIKLNHEFNEVVKIDGKDELSAIDLDIKVTGTLIIAKRA